jgi:hypothetical protein
VVPGERTAENVAAVVEDFKRRTGGRLMDLITTDGYPAYEGAILEAYGETITPPRTGKRGRPKAPYFYSAKLYSLDPPAIAEVCSPSWFMEGRAWTYSRCENSSPD